MIFSILNILVMWTTISIAVGLAVAPALAGRLG